MATLKLLLTIAVCSAVVHAAAVEYELDKPLDLPSGWHFLRRDDAYLQHQCSAATAERMTKRFSESSAVYRKKLSITQTRLPVQMRLYANAPIYRNKLKFSRQREGHFNARLNIISTHCGVSGTILDQQILLHVLQQQALRPWQKVFIAETLSTGANGSSFADAARGKPTTMEQVMLSNHTPGLSERAAMARLAEFLRKAGKLEDFAIALATESLSDDTGIELLERLMGMKISEFAKDAPRPSRKAVRNNTLRSFKK
ncbi:MAG: hypothetical protein U1F16_15705 [Turneriella sp.]